MSKIRTCLWFEKDGHEAALFYTSLIPGSEMETVVGEGPAPFMVNFRLAGAPYQIMSAGDRYKLSPAASISVMTEDQAETDRVWAALIADGGVEGQCGWCTDRWGVSWQVVPRALPGLIGGPDSQAAGRATQAMFKMHKIDIAALQSAYDDKG